MIPILDSLAHPTLNGEWKGRTKEVPTFQNLSNALRTNQYMGACAIGMGNISSYSHEAYMSACRNFSNVIPIAYFSQKSIFLSKVELNTVKQLGYKGIKIHPRFSGLDIFKEEHFELLSATLKEAGKLNLVVFYCTYNHCRLWNYPEQDPFYALVRLLKKAPETKVVLVHGGDVQLLRYSELVRFNPNLILDLSLSMMKYIGSSLDLDIRYLFQQFDRRICIGTDYPEYTHDEVRQRFDFFAQDIATNKKENIAFGNLCTFLNYEPRH